MPLEPLHHETIDRAIYLDFEGRGPSNSRSPSPTPTLAGTVVDGEYRLVVFEKDLFEASKLQGGKGMEIEPFLERVLLRAETQSRRIVHFSAHEPEVFEEHDLSLDTVGLDAKKWAKRICRETVAECKEANRVFRRSGGSASSKAKAKTKAFGLAAHCAASLGMPYHQGYGFGLVGKWIRTVQQQGHDKHCYSNWSRGAKASWTKLIKHNEFDCHAMRHILTSYVEQL